MDAPVIDIIDRLKEKGRSDLANLLIGCRSGVEQTDQYGSYWNHFVSCFIIYAPKQKYKQLQKISKDDKDLILQCILEIFPKSEDLEIGWLSFKLLPDEEILKQNQRLSASWLNRATNKLDEGEESLKKLKYSEGISSFQECIELSLKAISLVLLDKYSKDHKFDEKEFMKVLNNIPKRLEYLELHKLYLYSKFWGNFYTTAKYGLEVLSIGADELFEKEEAELAQKHAGKCYFAAEQLKNYLENPW